MTDYREIYRRNLYEVERPEGGHYSFSLANNTDNNFFDRPFAIITAYNPRNIPLSDDENRARNSLLYNELNSKWTVLAATGCLEGHCEAGFLVYDITLTEAVTLGKKYEQYAVFYNSAEVLQYIECESEKVIVAKRR